ncbi:MAG TPA: pyruvate formate lyase family protein [Acidobacteriaceae bacterium]|nr:pyruvate formate lyase family protein [Acidobacteriaceae bacterium]
MHHNDTQYWRYLQSLPHGHEDLPSPRVCRLLFRMFQRWRGRNAWLTADQVGHLFRNKNTPESQRREIAALPVAIRKSMAVDRMLHIVASPELSGEAGSSRIHPDELIVGTMPPYSVGQGKEFVRYLTEQEELDGEIQYLNELSPMGHIVPNHAVVLEKGLGAMVAECRAKATDGKFTKDQLSFYESVALSLEAVVKFAERHAKRAREKVESLPASDLRKRDLENVALNLEHAPRYPAKTFHQALQAIYIVHCALHWTAEIVPLGRLDQLLHNYYERDILDGVLTREKGQELIDCFWIKLDEPVILTPRHAENRFTSCDGQLTGSTGSANYDQGALLNQWMQQITIGGVLANDAEEATDASNDVTRLCLAAARRLPLNSPTLDLRVHGQTPDDLLELAAHALLSGGAHPVLLNDEIIIPALIEHTGASIPRAAARNYACDGCYETMVAGESEFSFGFVPALDLVEKTLNRGAGIAAAGTTNLRGFKASWRSKPAEQISSFAEFRAILREHMILSLHRYFHDLYTFYGNKEKIAPSPLLSALIQGCLESGRDLTAGGSNYHIFSPLLSGISSAADSLYVIQQLVFTENQFTLPELLACLVSDWGERLIQVGGDTVASFGTNITSDRSKAIRQICLQQPKFGSGDQRVDQLAWWLMETFADCVELVSKDKSLGALRKKLEECYGSDGKPFRMNIAPGVGTFEQYAFSGSFIGASADGRHSMEPIASDLSPAPIPADLPACLNGLDGAVQHARVFRLADSLRSYAHPVMRRFGDGAPVDYNIPEHMPVAELKDILRRFANGQGGSICTFTACDPQTFAAAQAAPESYNLLRVRMGGWTEFFITLFPNHQEQHKRRPLYV